MNLDHYDLYPGSGNFYYEFYSEGPKGRIRKLIQFHLVQDSPDVVYNLGFGDWVDETGDVDDLAVSNNNDRKRVLSTVAQAVLAFTRKHKNAFIVAKGSTPSRTRLYQMGIAEFYYDIESLFHVSGRIGSRWLAFEKGKNYDAFLIKRK